MKRFFVIILAGLMLAALTACGQGSGEEVEYTGMEHETTAPYIFQWGEGETTFRLIVIQDDIPRHFDVSTGQEYLGDALLEVGLVEGEETPMGLLVTHVAGSRAVYLLDGAWWRFTINGEDSFTGVSQVIIDPDATYTFIHTLA